MSYYDPSDSQRNLINKTLDRYEKMQFSRDRKYNYFNDRNLLGYVDDSTRRWNGYIPPRDDLSMDWQARVFNNFTRNVVINFLAKVSTRIPKSRITATTDGFNDRKKAHILEKLYAFSRNKEDGTWKFLQASLECVTKGTVIAYEGYKKVKRKIKEVKSYDPTTGKVEYDEKEIVDYDDCFQSIVPLEEFYVSNVWEEDLQKQPDIVWKRLVKKADFDEEYAKYPNSRYVKGGAYTNLNEQQSFYKNKLMSELETDQVEIISYFNRLKDQMLIIANGVMLYDGPIPFSHKMYPFVKTIFEPHAIDFFYGKSLPAKIEQDQDIINTLWNMMIDQSYLSIFKPILTDDEDEVEDTVLVPGLIRKVNDINKYKVLNELQGPDQTHFNMLNLALKFAQDNSGIVLGGGVAATQHGGKVTARQAMMLEESSRQILGLNSRFLEKFERDTQLLRVKNILQFYTLPQMNKSGEDAKVFRINDTELTDGTHGVSLIRMSNELPQQEDLDIEAEMGSIEGENMEVHAITPEYIRNVDFNVQIITESSWQQSKSLVQAQGLEFYQTLLQSPYINQEENTREFVMLYDKDPERFMAKQPAMAGMPGQEAPGNLPAISSQILDKKKIGSLDSLLSQ